MCNIVIIYTGEVYEYIRLNHTKLLLYRKKKGQTAAVYSGSNYYVKAKSTVCLLVPGTALNDPCLSSSFIPGNNPWMIALHLRRCGSKCQGSDLSALPNFIVVAQLCPTLCNCCRLFATPWTAACQTSLNFIVYLFKHILPEKDTPFPPVTHFRF